MTPAQALDQIIPGWQASLADKYSPAFIINLVSKHRASLEEMVAAVLGSERLKKGKRPKYDYDFAPPARGRRRTTSPTTSSFDGSSSE